MGIKIFRKIKPDFVDERGEITKILDDGKTIIKSILLITSRKGSVRANHYHKKDSHYVYVISGKMEYFENPVSGSEHLGSEQRNSVVVEAGDMIYTPPMTEHAMRFLEDSAFLTMSTESRAQESYEQDTVRIKLI